MVVVAEEEEEGRSSMADAVDGVFIQAKRAEVDYHCDRHIQYSSDVCICTYMKLVVALLYCICG